jgi:hypothetical protein
MVNPAALLLLFGTKTWTFEGVEVNLVYFRHTTISMASSPWLLSKYIAFFIGARGVLPR